MADTPNGMFPYVEGPGNLLKEPIQKFQRNVETAILGITGVAGGPIYTVFGRSGPAISAASGDYTWGQIDKTTSSLADISIRSASDLNTGTLSTGRGGTGTGSLTSNAPLYGNGSGTVQTVPVNATATKKFLAQVSSGAPSFDPLAASDVGLGSVTNDAQLKIASNLADLGNAAVARANLGVAIGSNVQAWDGDLDAIAAISATVGLLKKTAANTWSLDTNTYLTANQTITLSGDVSGSGATAITTVIGPLKVLNSMIANTTIDLTAKVTGILPSTNGGTGVNNTGTITNAVNTIITGGGTLALGGFTFTVPATGTGVITSRTITEGAGLAGNTYDLSANRTLALGLPSSLSGSSANSASGTTHSHAIDSTIARAAITISVSGLGLSGGGDLSTNRTITLASSSNPGAAAAILATDVNGYVTTVRQTTTDYMFINNATANLYMKDVSSGWQVASTQVITPQSGNSVRSTSYTSGLVGWNMSAAGNAEVNNLDARGAIHAGIFVYNALQVTAGTQVITPSGAKLRTDVTIPSAPTYGTTTVTVDVTDQDGLTHAASQLFVVNDILQLKDGLVGSTWLKVTAVSDQTTFWRYTASIQAGTNNVVYRAGVGVPDYKQSGYGFITLTADQANAPYIQMATHAGTFSSSGASGTLVITPQMRMGNLNGSYGYSSDIYGFGAGQYGAPSKSWLTIDQTNGIRIGNNAITIGQWDISGNLTLGEVATNQGNAFWNNTTKTLQFRGGTAGTVVQAYVDTTGAIVAGAGAVTLDSNGLTISNGTGTPNYVKFVQGSFKTGSLINYYTADGLGVYSSYTQIAASLQAADPTGYSKLTIIAVNEPATSKSCSMSIYSHGSASTRPNSTYATFVGGVDFATGNNDSFAGLTLGEVQYPRALLDMYRKDAVTAAMTDMVVLDHRSSGTPATNFGTSILFQLKSSTSEGRDAARLGAIWTTATEGSQTSAVVIRTVNSAGALAEVGRFAGNGDFTITGLLKAGSGPTTLTNAAGALLPASINGYPSDATKFLSGAGTWIAAGGMAIGGSITSATAGSILYAGASGVLAQDNANFFWDGTNHYLGIGTTSPSSSITWGSGGGRIIDIKSSSSSVAYVLHGPNGIEGAWGMASSGSGMAFDAGGAATASDNFIVFRTTNTANSYNTLTERARISSTGTLKLSAYGAGTLTTDASGNVTASSDERLKHIVRPFTRGLAELRLVQPVIYRWRAGFFTEDTTTEYAGFTTQNVGQDGAIPEAVFSNGQYETLWDRGILGAVVNGIRELDANHNELVGRVEMYKQMLLDLGHRVADLEAELALRTN